MALYHEDIAEINLNGGSLHRSFKSVSIGTGDKNANRFGMKVFRDGVPVDLDGVTCQAVFQDPRGNNIALTSHGTVSGNLAYVTLPQACYNYEGRFCLAIKLIGGGVTGTMRIIDGVINNTHSGSTVAPTGAVPTYQEVLAAYDDAIAAVATVAKLNTKVNTMADADSIVFEGKNAIEPESTTPGYRIRTSNGNAASNDNYFITDYSPVKAGMTMMINHTFDSSSYGTAFYDADKTFLTGSGVAGTQKKMIVPEGAAYARTTFRSSVTDAEVSLSYSMTNDMNTMEEMMSRFYEEVKMELEQGTISTSGSPSTSDTRIRSRDYFLVTKTPLFLHIREGLKVSYRIYDSNSAESFVSYGGFYSEDRFIPAKIGQYIRIVIAKENDADIQSAECQDYNPVWILNLDTMLDKQFTAPNTEAVKYSIDSVNQFVEEISGYKNYIWGIGYIYTTASHVDKDDIRYNSNYRHCVIPCSEGDSFFINAVYCETYMRPYSFIDEDGDVIAQRTRGSAQNLTITAPAGAAYLVCNSGKMQNGEWNCKLHTLSKDMDTEGDQEILNKVQQLARARRVNKILQTPPLVLLHFSDIHADVINLGRVMAFYGKHNQYIHDVIHTGDNVDDEYADGFSWWDTVEGSENILNLIGNHDSNEKTGGNNNWYAISEQDDYDTFIAPYVSNWGVTYTSGHCYYYKDSATNNVRLICLDAMHLTEDQLTWFTETLASAKTAGLHVLVATHMRGHFPETPLETNFNDTFLTDTANPSYSSSYKEYMPPEYSDAVQGFIDEGGNFVAWICGHTHYDVFAKLNRHTDQVQICVSLGGIANANTSAGARVRNTKSQDLFNVIAVDTYSKIVKIVRVGADYNLMMQHKDTLCYNYETGTLIV